MGRTNKSVFCAKCKKRLCTAVQQGVAAGYAFDNQEKVREIFDPHTIAAVEGYLYGVIVCVDLDYGIRSGEALKKDNFEKYLQRVAMGERSLHGEELEKFSISLLDNAKMAIGGHLVDHPECLVERYLDLSLYYLRRIAYKGLGVIPIPMEAPSERAAEGDEIDAICDAIEAVLEKV